MNNEFLDDFRKWVETSVGEYLARVEIARAWPELFREDDALYMSIEEMNDRIDHEILWGNGPAWVLDH